MPRIRILLACILVGLAFPGHSAVPADMPSEAEVDTALARALGWIEQHPSSPRDGGLPDMVDEALLWLLLANLAPGAIDRGRNLATLGERLSVLSRLPELAEEVRRPGKTLLDHYHLVLAAYLSERAGVADRWRPSVMAQAQRALATSSRDHPTVRLGIAILLERLGVAPLVPVERLLEEGAIAYVALRGRPIAFPRGLLGPEQQQGRMLLYAIVHEVVALADFGREPLSLWVAARRDAVAPVIREGIAWALAERDHDLLAELVVAGHLLQEPWSGPQLDGIRLLLGEQHADGSWGASTTTRRSNKVRHAVLTATVALSIFRTGTAAAEP